MFCFVEKLRKAPRTNLERMSDMMGGNPHSSPDAHGFSLTAGHKQPSLKNRHGGQAWRFCKFVVGSKSFGKLRQLLLGDYLKQELYPFSAKNSVREVAVSKILVRNISRDCFFATYDGVVHIDIHIFLISNAFVYGIFYHITFYPYVFECQR